MNKQTFLLGILTMSGALMSIYSCGETPAERKKDATEAVSDAKQDVKDANKDLANASQDVAKALQAERDDLAVRIKRQNQEIETEITEIDRKLEKATAKEKIRWQERRARLVVYRDGLNADLKRAGADLKDEWTDFKTVTVSKMDKIAEDLKAE